MRRPWILPNQLLKAIENGDVAAAEEVINNGFDIDSCLMDGRSAISICAERGKSEIAQLLIKKGCSLSLRTPSGFYPLHLAVFNGDIAVVQMLLNNRADVTALDFCRRTALHLACELNLLDIAKALIERSTASSLNIPDMDRKTPLMYACLYSTKELVEYLLEKGSHVNVSDRCGNGPLLQCIVNVTCSLKCEMMKLLLDAGADVGYKNHLGETALLRVLHNAYIQFQHSFGRIKEEYQKIVMMLIDYGSNLGLTNSLGQSPLHLAVCANDKVIIKKLINAGCQVDTFDQLGLNPIYYACRNANKEVLNLLVKSGANLKAYNFEKLKEHLKTADSCALVDYLIEKTMELQPLRALCRTVIRKSFKYSIEKNAKFLHIPNLLSDYIINFDQ